MNLDAVGIVSENISRSQSFYELLGIQFKTVGEDHLEAYTTNGLRLMLDAESLVKRINPDWQKSNGSKVILCFKQHSADEVDVVYEKMIRSGFKGVKDPWDAFWGQRYASILDPDGNQVDLFADLL